MTFTNKEKIVNKNDSTDLAGETPLLVQVILFDSEYLSKVGRGYINVVQRKIQKRYENMQTLPMGVQLF